MRGRRGRRPYCRDGRAAMTTVVSVREAPVERLTRIWETPRGLYGVLVSVDHKTIGKRYLVTALLFFLIGGLEASAMRVQLAHGDNRLLSPEAYDQLFTMHGVTMLFLFASPILSGFANYLWPLMIGARDMAFPRANAVSYWIYLFAGVFIYSSVLVAQAPDGGWFGYVPMTEHAFSPGLNLDFYALGLVFVGVSTTIGAANFITTFFTLRAPGMSVDRVPVILWGTLTASFTIMFFMPPLTVACVLLYMDRHLGTSFFDPTHGGHPLLWQHLFWIFGHPWVYIIVLPAMGLASDMIPTFTRRPLAGYTLCRVIDGRDGDPGLRRLGPPHVRDRAPATVDGLLQCGQHGHRGRQWRVGVCMARDDLVRAAAVRDAVAVPLWVHRPVRDRRGERRHDGRGAVRLAAHGQLLRRRASPLRPARDQRIPCLRGGVLLVPEDDRPDAE